MSSRAASVDLEVARLSVQSLHLGAKNGHNVSEQVLVRDEASGEEAQRVLEERMVVLSVEDRGLHIADQVLEEGADHNVDDLADLEVHVRGQSGARMERFEVLATSDVLLSGLLVELVERRVRKLLLVDRAAEVE